MRIFKLTGQKNAASLHFFEEFIKKNLSLSTRMSSTKIPDERMISTRTKTISEKDLSSMLSQPDLFTSARTRQSSTSIKSLRKMSSRMKVAPRQTESLQFFPNSVDENFISEINEAVAEQAEYELDQADEKKSSYCCCFL
ncbi:unnamed protein product [Oikopleura dioica]|uniref:Uncharacterized protein n=2 Tax=Oikopleura dioica TaxID=34765 RepID=E4XS05_OIKDI|nr:unnamed protein product [Oikopleura dioica]